MELKPSKDKAGIKVRLDGLGGQLQEGEHRNPWAQLARGSRPKQGLIGQLPDKDMRDRRRRWAADTLGATPQRDGPWSLGAADVAMAKPPKARKKRSADPGLPFLKPR